MKKRCCTCKVPKKLEEFGKNKSQKDGLQRSCKICCKQSREKFKGEYNNEAGRKWRRDNQEHFRKYRKDWYNKNSQKWTIYSNKRRKEDIYFRLVSNLKSRIWHALRGKLKKDKSILLLGCSPTELKQHLESKFKKGMIWDNYGEWHVDHKKPCAAFDLSIESEQRKCFNYKNLQPLWAVDNRRKSDKH